MNQATPPPACPAFPRDKTIHVLLTPPAFPGAKWTAVCGRKGTGSNVVPSLKTLKPLQNLGHLGKACKSCQLAATAREHRRLSRAKYPLVWEPSDPAEVLCKALVECRTPPTLHQLKLAYVRAAMAAHGNNASHAASTLGVDRATVTTLVRRYLTP